PLLPFPVLEKQQKRLLRAQFVELYRHWRVEYEKAHPAPPIENVKFEHDPDWRNGLFSITNAHEGNTRFWKTINVVLAPCAGSIGLIAAFNAETPIVGFGLLVIIYALSAAVFFR